MAEEQDINQTVPPEDLQNDISDEGVNACENCEGVKTQMEEYKSGWQRATADYKNLQREMNEKRGEWIRMSELQVLEEFIPVYDNFKKAFSHQPGEGEEKKWQNWAQGIQYIMKQFSDIIKNHHVEEIKTIGEMFNPHLHDAMGEEESEQPEGTIIREMDAGYTMSGKVVKPAKVIIAKAK